jgi:hypothetical protein
MYIIPLNKEKMLARYKNTSYRIIYFTYVFLRNVNSDSKTIYIA